MDKPDRRMVFCDFDGTVTVQETFSSMLMELAPEKAREVLDAMWTGQCTLAQGVRQLLESLPSSAYRDIIAFSEGREVRPGFVELLDFLDDRQVPFVLISGGLYAMIQVILGALIPRFAAVYALSLDLSGPFVKVNADFEGEGELLAKAQVMRLYDYDHGVAIGDGVTDVNMALAADTVFARDGLARRLKKKGRSFSPWEDFHDIIARLDRLWA